MLRAAAGLLHIDLADLLGEAEIDAIEGVGDPRVITGMTPPQT